MIKLPQIIQGGMGAGVSNWILAKKVSQMGHLGVVSGTALDTILLRRLQDGDLDGNMRRSLLHFPIPGVAQEIIDKYYIPGGKAKDAAYKRLPLYTHKPSLHHQKLTVAANFVEVFLAKEGHNGIVGTNFLEKIQLPNLYSIYGAMLASVDYVLMGAGIPVEIPGVIDKFVHHEETTLKLNVEEIGSEDDFYLRFNPKELFQEDTPQTKLKRPNFIAIISSVVLAMALIKRSKGIVNGFVIEGPTAGGHNAPPRGKGSLNEQNEPTYTDKDKVDLSKIKDLGRPFWLAGSHGSPEGFRKALEAGANGIQVGTAFAFTKESGFSEDIKRKVLEKALRDELKVKTDGRISPSGFPFKVISMEDSGSEDEVYKARPKICDVGYLRHAYYDKGKLSYRCPSEVISDYLKKGGKIEETVGRKCLCNSLLANIDQPQIQKGGYEEKTIITAGDDFSFVHHILKDGNLTYSAEDVLNYILSPNP